MNNKDNIISAVSMEEIINNLPEVISSKIVLDDNNEVEEIHVLSDTSRNPKQISRDIQSALTAKFGIDIDHKKISIAQINFKQNLNNDFRLRINSINYSTLGNIAEVKVLLQKGNEIIEGNAKGTNTTINSYRLLSLATLDCIHSLLNISNTFVVEDIERITLAKKDVIITAIGFITSSGTEELLVGSAIVRKDEKESIVKATLDAINRKIVRFND
ncbi:MAG: hypothetical protein PWQ37_1879 [Candidatus Petromonas sp.]|jgi:hypothetical protein|nr:hypothetical protein [Candidatus Petromonas sp.]